MGLRGVVAGTVGGGGGGRLLGAAAAAKAFWLRRTAVEGMGAARKSFGRGRSAGAVAGRRTKALRVG